MTSPTHPDTAPHALTGGTRATESASPGVTVVIPVLNDARALRGVLAALAVQTVAPAEIIVVDNSPAGPADADVAAVAAGRGARVIREPRRGVAAASAAGFDAARSELIGRLDADSRPAPTWIATILERMRNGRLDGLTGPGVFYDLPGLRGRLAAAVYRTSLVLGVGAAMGNVPLWGSSMAIRRDAWLQVRGVVHRDDPAVHDDLDLAFALGPLARIGWSRELRVGVEGRTFHSPEALRSRIARTMYTCRLHWQRQGPGERCICRLTNGRVFRDDSFALSRGARALVTLPQRDEADSNGAHAAEPT